MFKSKFLISGSEDSKIVIWRCKDWTPLHSLKIKNTSKIESLSLHKSGKMLLALYGNCMLRLWDMTTARCVFKKKMGLVEDEELPVAIADKVIDEEEDKISGDGDPEEFGEDEIEEMGEGDK